MTDEIDHLKRNRIEPPLPAPGGDHPWGMPSDPVSEAFGGTGETPTSPIDVVAVREQVIVALKLVHDPEIPVNIYDLGLIYHVHLTELGALTVEMTLTAPACPVAGALVQEVAQRTGSVAGVARSHVKLTWDPPWTPERMTDAARLELGFF